MDSEIIYSTEKITFDKYYLNVTTVSYLPLEILLENSTKEKEISGSKVWKGSKGIIDYFMSNRKLIKNKNIIELGAGTGILGMMCKILGASKIILTDNDLICLKHMKNDLLINNIEGDVILLDWFFPNKIPNKIDIIVAGDVLYKKSLLDPFMTIVKLLLNIL